TASIPQTQAAQGPQPNPTTSATPASSGSGKAVALNSPARSGSGDAAGSVLRKSSANWSWDGGTAVTVAPGDSVETIARRYGVPAQSANVVAPPDALDKEAAKLADGNGAVPKFRWPANGRVIAGYGPTTNGQQNDGINISVPENTPVKAAEDGIVAYAGSELKGYGNLVLVRHPNGYVTAYAHAKELLVKRGDQVKRGQVIARSGQTGNVNTPQLHFEIRKGSSPLDPTRFLNGA